MFKIKKIFLNKSFNIINKLKGCINCHKIFKIKNIFFNLNKNIKYLFKELKKFKKKKRYNTNMNYLITNLKNKYLIEISKFFYFLTKIKFLKIKYIKYIKQKKIFNNKYFLNIKNFKKIFLKIKIL